MRCSPEGAQFHSPGQRPGTLLDYFLSGVCSPRTMTREPGRSQKYTRSAVGETATDTFLQPPVSATWPTSPRKSPLALNRLTIPSDSAVNTSTSGPVLQFIGLQQPPK